ncbi:hypothetical protein PanWU01x14_286350 [Parasponia andersonii]|uniref:RNase H type-1 domain-containing protein n=1 Tax=Parasponia andersonii TaxID=3476 RepID=A0A2P5AZB4_PARAD|nr:hypothetical protein PanWU01x14_286350 [Parasponia andersonii]
MTEFDVLDLGWLTIYTDASLVSVQVGLAAIFQDSSGNISRVVYKFDSALNALDAELKAIHMALITSNDLG